MIRGFNRPQSREGGLGRGELVTGVIAGRGRRCRRGLTGGPRASARGEREAGCGLLAGTMLGRAGGREEMGRGWLARPVGLFFFPFPFSNFLFSEKQITFEILVQMDSNQFE